MNENAVATIGHNEYNDKLLNNKCIRPSMNKIQSKDHRIETYEIKIISLSCCDDKIHIQNNRYDLKSFFVKDIVLIFSLIRTAFFSSKLFQFSV